MTEARIRKPLNGEKTRPLSGHGINALRHLKDFGPTPAQRFNPGVVNRLLREGLAAIVRAISPYATHKGRYIEHLKITDAGDAALAGAAPGARTQDKEI